MGSVARMQSGEIVDKAPGFHPGYGLWVYAGSTSMRPTISMCKAWQNQLQ